MYFRIKAVKARIITNDPKVGSAVLRVNPNEEKLKKRPTKAVIAKLSPIEKAIRSTISNEIFFGNSVSVKQKPGKKATRIKEKM